MRLISAIFLVSFFMIGCASLPQQANYYFTDQKTYASVEGVDKMNERLRLYQKERQVSGQGHREREMKECLILRNQLFVASLHGGDKAVKDAAKMLEEGFQADDKTFIDTCFQVRNTKVGHVFMEVQHENMAGRR